MTDATVVITTRNRKAYLRAALQSVAAQSVPVDVLVMDDASEDGTSEMVEAEFPGVRLDRGETMRGVVVQRNRAAEMVTTPYIFSIDDDAEFSTPDVVAQTLAEFDDPRVGAVAIPFIDVKVGPTVHQRAPDAGSLYIADVYIGTAHAVRLDVFRAIDGYRGDIFHQGEERDLCIRMIDAGYVIRVGSADPVHHHVSPTRDLTRMHVYGRRNDVLFAWQNVPLRFLPLHLAGTTVNGLLTGLRCGALLKMIAGLARGYAACLTHQRRPVRPATYRLSRGLKAGGPRLIGEVAALLPQAKVPTTV